MDNKEKLRMECLEAAIRVKHSSMHFKADDNNLEKEKDVLTIAKEFESFVVGEEK